MSIDCLAVHDLHTLTALPPVVHESLARAMAELNVSWPPWVGNAANAAQILTVVVAVVTLLATARRTARLPPPAARPAASVAAAASRAGDPPGTIADPEERLSRALRLHRHCLAEIAEILESSSSGAAPPVSARRPDPPARAEAAELVGAGSSERGR